MSNDTNTRAKRGKAKWPPALMRRARAGVALRAIAVSEINQRSA